MVVTVEEEEEEDGRVWIMVAGKDIMVDNGRGGGCSINVGVI